MSDQDQDIADLERLLGAARADYRALRHPGGVRAAGPVQERAGGRTEPHRARRRGWRLGRYALAASVLLAVGVALSGGLGGWGGGDRPSRFSPPGPIAGPLTLRPSPPEGFVVPSRPSRATFRLPKRPQSGRG